MNTRSGKLPVVSPSISPKKNRKKSNNKHETIYLEKQIFEKGTSTSSNMENPNARFNEPMWNRTRTLAPTPGSAIVKPDIGANFAVKGNHMKMIQENQFDGHFLSDPYKHIANFEEICEMFRYGPNTDEPVKLRLFSLSLTGESKSWFNELETGSIETWNQMKDAFAHRFFPPGLAQKLINDIRSFKQYEKENLIDAWIRLQNMIRKCHGHGLDKEQIINIFYYGLDEDSQILLDSAGGGIFLYKSANDACKIMEDKVMMRMSKSKGIIDRPIKKVVAFAETKEESSELVAKLDDLASRLDNRFGKMEKDLYALKYGCEHCGGRHNSEECDTPGGREEANFVQNNYQGNNQRGWNQTRSQGTFNSGYNSNTNNFPTRYPRNNQYNQQYPQRPRDEIQQQSQPKPNDEEITLSSLHRLMVDFIDTQKITNASVNSKLEILKKNMEQGQRNHQACINELEKGINRLSEKDAGRPTGTLPSNTQPNPRPIPPPGPGAPNSNHIYQPPPTRNEHLNAISTSIDNNYRSSVGNTGTTDPVLLVPEPVEDDFKNEEVVEEKIEIGLNEEIPQPKDPNWQSEARDAQLKKDKMEEVNAITTEESHDDYLPPKLGDPGSFLISCSFNDMVTYNGLADLGASINLMPYSLYKRLFLKPLAPSSINIQLADRSLLFPLGIAENVLVRVGNLTFPVDFVVLNIMEDTQVPIILGRPFLQTANAVIHIRSKVIVLGINNKRMAFKVNKSKSHSNIVNHTCHIIDRQDLAQGAEEEPHEPAEEQDEEDLNGEPSDSESSDEESDDESEPSEVEDDPEQEEAAKPDEVKEVENFKQGREEYLASAWQRMIQLMRACPEYSVSNEECVLFFYHGLDEYAKRALNEAAGGSFLSIPARDACNILHTQSYVREFERWLYGNIQRDEQVGEREETTVEYPPKEITDKNDDNMTNKDEAGTSGGDINYRFTQEMQVLEFEQGDGENIDDAWARINTLRQACSMGRFRDADFLYHFYNGLNDCAQEALDKTTDRFFLYLPYRNACRMLNERTYEIAYKKCLDKEKEKDHTNLPEPLVADAVFVNTGPIHEVSRDTTRKLLTHTLSEHTVTFEKVQEKLLNLLSEIQDEQQLRDMGNSKLELRIKEILDIHLDSPLGNPRVKELFKEIFIRGKQPMIQEAKRRIDNTDEAECSKKQKIQDDDNSQDEYKAYATSPKVSSDLPNTSSVGESEKSSP